VAVITAGSSIALSTTIFQTITHNRILTPSVMGLDALYTLWQTAIVFIFSSDSVLVHNLNLNFMVTVALMICFAYLMFRLVLQRDPGNIYFLLLIGLIAGTLFQSLSSFMQMLIDPNEFMVLQGKLFASFNSINLNVLTISAVICGITWVYARRYYSTLDVLALGRDQALNLGVNYDQVVWRLLVVVFILVSVSTALVGPITFLGLLVVNLAWQFMPTYRHQTIVYTAFMLSMVALVGGQLLVERILNFAVPLSTLINLFGGLYFMKVLLKEK